MREQLNLIISREAISAKVDEMAARISSDYAGKEIVAVGILKGAWIFMADLVRRLSVPVQCDFIGISSYGCDTETTGVVRITSDLTINISGRHVLLIEDIVDTGMTTQYLLDNFRTRQPAGLRICALLDKADRRRVTVPLDYVGFPVPDRFLVGYGLDYAQKYRQLPGVSELQFIPE